MTQGDKSVNTEVSGDQAGTSMGETQAQLDAAKAHKEAADALSRTAEELINTKIELAELNPKSILKLDSKMQAKVIKKIYGYDNLEELKLIHGDNFFDKRTEEEIETDETEILKREVAILKNRQSKGELERAIKDFQKENPEIFEDEDALDNLKAELEYVSDKLPVEERIKKASRVAFGNVTNNEHEAYAALREKSFGQPQSRGTTEQGNPFLALAKKMGHVK